MTSASFKWPGSSVVRNDAAMRYVVIIAWCAILLGIILRLTQLPTRVVYLDEAYTQIRVAGHTASEMIRTLYDGRERTAFAVRRYAIVDSTSSAGRLVSSLKAEDAQHPPLFYLAEFVFVRTLGNALIFWRLAPALFGILALPAAYALARELFADSRAGLLAAAVFAVSPIERIYSDQAREYSLFTLLVLVGTLVVVRAIRTNTLRTWALYALVAAAGLYANPFMFYVIAAHGVFALRVSLRSPRLTLPPFAVASAVALGAYAPWLYELIVHRKDIAETNVWSAAPWPFVRLAAKWVFNTGSTFFDLEYVDLRWGIAFAAVAFVAALTIVRGFRAADAQARWCCGTAIVVPAILLVAPDILLGEHRSSVARYGLPIFAMLAVVAARGIVGRPVAASIILGAGLCSSVVGSLQPSWWDNDSNADDARIAALISSVPHAQVMSTLSPPLFVTFARALHDDVRVSLSPDIADVRFSPNDPLFVLRPSANDLRTLQKRTGRMFVRVPFARTVTAHEIGTTIGKKSETAGAIGDLYRAVDERTLNQ